METKKSKTANLEPKRLLFFQIGIIAILSLSLIAFEWRVREITILDNDNPWAEILEEEPINITYRSAKPIPPPIAKKAKNVDVILIVKNETPVAAPILTPKEEPKITELLPVGEPEEKEDVVPFVLVERKPVFPGCEGLSADQAFVCFQKGLIKHIREEIIYPAKAWEMGVYGKVYVSFVINKEGLIEGVTIARSVDQYLDAEALRVIKMLPQMTPAKQRDKPVAIMYSVPIAFNISR
jgi:protein TonB